MKWGPLVPPGKDRENLHISMPKDMKDQLTQEAARRSMTVSDLVCENIERSYRQDQQWQLDLQRILELISQKTDKVLAQQGTMMESLAKALTPPEEQPELPGVPDFSYLDPSRLPVREEPRVEPAKKRPLWRKLVSRG